MLLWRSLRLRCPRCGNGRLFRGWFRMAGRCDACGFSYEREPGFFLGSIYFNYGLTSLITAILYPALHFGWGLPNGPVMAACATFAVLFPIWFFRYARALWLGFDEWVDPRDDPRQRAGGGGRTE